MSHVAEYCAGLPVFIRRVIALVVVPLMLVMIILALWVPAAHIGHSQREWRAEAGRLLARARGAPVEGAALDEQIEALYASELWSKFYSDGQGVSGTTALHAELTTLLSAVQAGVQSLAPIAAEELPHFTKIGVRLSVSLRVNQLQELLAALAAHPRYLRVERLLVVAPQGQPHDDNPPLAVTMDVYGYELAEDVRPRRANATPASLEVH